MFFCTEAKTAEVRKAGVYDSSGMSAPFSVRFLIISYFLFSTIGEFEMGKQILVLIFWC